MTTLISIIEDSPIFSIIGAYLNPKDIENLFYSSQTIFKNKNNKFYTNLLIKNICCIKIQNFFHMSKYKFRYIEKINFEDNLKNQNIALYYFKYYDKQYINSWYNTDIQWKRNILDYYGRKNIENPTKYDLFRLMSKMTPEDIFSIGW